MISDYDLDAWTENFDEAMKATLQHVTDVEDWPCDHDERVQAILNKVAGVASTTSPQNPLLFSELLEQGRADNFRDAFRKISEEEVIELQAQLIFPRALKLFGDLVNLEPEVAKKLIATELFQSEKEEIVIGARTLVSRILFLSKMSIFQRIFSDKDQLAFVTEALENYEF